MSTICKTFNADKKLLDDVNVFIMNSIQNTPLTPKAINEISLCVEEVFVNVASYAYDGKEGNVDVVININENDVDFMFIDSGEMFDPLAKPDPNLMASFSERSIGGLGIFLVKQMMNKVTYEYKDNKNVFTMTKNY